MHRPIIICYMIFGKFYYSQKIINIAFPQRLIIFFDIKVSKSAYKNHV